MLTIADTKLELEPNTEFKVLILNREIRPDRITMIIVKEELGY